MIVLPGILLFGFGHHLQTGEQADKTVAVHEDADRVVKMDLEGLKPERVENVRGLLLAVRGVHSVEFGPNNKEVVVRFDLARTDLLRIRRALEGAGCTPYFH